jgi:hypothetical protein
MQYSLSVSATETLACSQQADNIADQQRVVKGLTIVSLGGFNDGTRGIILLYYSHMHLNEIGPTSRDICLT